MRTRVCGTRLPKGARRGAIRSSVSVWARTPASSSFASDSASAGRERGRGRSPTPRPRRGTRRRAAPPPAGASVRMPCSVTPSARANCRRTPGCAGSKPPRKPARPAPIRNVTAGAGSPTRRGVRGEAALGLLAPGEGEGEGGVGRDLAALLGRVRHRDEHADRRLGSAERGPERRRRRMVLRADPPLEREVEGLEQVRQAGEGADVLAQRDEADAGDAFEQSRASLPAERGAQEGVPVGRPSLRTDPPPPSGRASRS